MNISPAQRTEIDRIARENGIEFSGIYSDTHYAFFVFSISHQMPFEWCKFAARKQRCSILEFIRRGDRRVESMLRTRTLEGLHTQTFTDNFPRQLRLFVAPNLASALAENPDYLPPMMMHLRGMQIPPPSQDFLYSDQSVSGGMSVASQSTHGTAHSIQRRMERCTISEGATGHHSASEGATGRGFPEAAVGAGGFHPGLDTTGLAADPFRGTGATSSGAGSTSAFLRSGPQRKRTRQNDDYAWQMDDNSQTTSMRLHAINFHTMKIQDIIADQFVGAKFDDLMTLAALSAPDAERMMATKVGDRPSLTEILGDKFSMNDQQLALAVGVKNQSVWTTITKYTDNQTKPVNDGKEHCRALKNQLDFSDTVTEKNEADDTRRIDDMIKNLRDALAKSEEEKKIMLLQHEKRAILTKTQRAILADVESIVATKEKQRELIIAAMNCESHDAQSASWCKLAPHLLENFNIPDSIKEAHFPKKIRDAHEAREAAKLQDSALCGVEVGGEDARVDEQTVLTAQTFGIGPAKEDTSDDDNTAMAAATAVKKEMATKPEPPKKNEDVTGGDNTNSMAPPAASANPGTPKFQVPTATTKSEEDSWLEWMNILHDGNPPASGPPAPSSNHSVSDGSSLGDVGDLSLASVMRDSTIASANAAPSSFNAGGMAGIPEGKIEVEAASVDQEFMDILNDRKPPASGPPAPSSNHSVSDGSSLGDVGDLSLASVMRDSTIASANAAPSSFNAGGMAGIPEGKIEVEDASVDQFSEKNEVSLHPDTANGESFMEPRKDSLN